MRTLLIVGYLFILTSAILIAICYGMGIKDPNVTSSVLHNILIASLSVTVLTYVLNDPDLKKGGKR